MCITLLKVVSYYDLSVMFMSVMDLKKKKRGVSSILFYFGCLLTLESP